MKSWQRWFSRKKKWEQDLSEELRFHIEQQTAANIAAGMPHQEARRQAMLQLGAIEGVKEYCREERHAFWLESLWTDVRYGARMLRKSPGFTIVAILTLALGIGANTAIFSLIEAVLLRPLPYKDPGRLMLFTDVQDPEGGGFLHQDLEPFEAQTRSFASIAFYFRDTGFSRVTLTSAGDPEFVHAAFVSAGLFPILGTAPELGRAFTPEEEKHQARVVVLSHGLWVRRFGASRAAIGNTLQINGVNSQIVGVMPATFHFPETDQEFWAPITTAPYWSDPSLTPNVGPRHNRYFYERWQAAGRLNPGVSLARAQAETDAIFARIRQADPDEDRGIGIHLAPLRLNTNTDTRLALFVLFSAVSFVLLIACTNVANLVLARGAARGREMAVRTALGAGRGRLVRQLLTESTVLALLAGCLGLIFTALGVRALVVLAPAGIPRIEEARVDAGVLAFTLGVSLFAAVFFGLAPAWKISRNDPGESLKSGSRGATGSAGLKRARGALVVSEFALAVVLLTGAGLLIRSLLAAMSMDPGFQLEHLVTMNIVPATAVPAEQNALYDSVLGRVRALPGVQSAGEVSELFEFEKMNNNSLRETDGRAPEPMDHWSPFRWASVRGDFFQAVGAPLLRGRYFSEQDGPDSPLVAIIDEGMARRFWPSEDPIGRRFKGQDPRGHNDDWITVVGIVRDMRRSGMETKPFPHVFEPYTQAIEGHRTGDLVVRTGGDPRAVAAELRGAVRELDSAAILSRVTTGEEELSVQLSPRRFQTWLLGLFSLIALVLASVGIFGVIHYSVEQRTHEIGIRMALGAQRGDVLKLVLSDAARMTVAGLSIGVAAALALTRLMAALLFGVSASDLLTFAGVAILLGAVALAASYVPARRAMLVDPMVALRYE